MSFRGASSSFSVMVVLAAFAFWRLYLSRLTGDIDPYAHFHAGVAVPWCALLIVQPLLIRKRMPLHRRLGARSYVLAPLFVIASVFLAHSRFSAMDPARFLVEAPTLFLPLSRFPGLHLAWFTVAQAPLWLPLASPFRALPPP